MAKIIVLIELMFFFGGALAFAAWEIHKMKKLRETPPEANPLADKLWGVPRSNSEDRNVVNPSSKQSGKKKQDAVAAVGTKQERSARTTSYLSPRRVEPGDDRHKA